MLRLKNIAVLILLASCNKTQFKGQSSGTEKPATFTEQKPIPPPVPPPPIENKTPCENTLATIGVRSGAYTYLLLQNKLPYDDGVKECANKGPSGSMIYQGQNLPDEVLACQRKLGTLWMRADKNSDSNGLNLWQPTYGGQDDRQSANWVICYFNS